MITAIVECDNEAVYRDAIEMPKVVEHVDGSMVRVEMVRRAAETIDGCVQIKYQDSTCQYIGKRGEDTPGASLISAW